MSEVHKRMLNSTLLPLNSIVYRGSDPLDLASYTVKFQMETETGGTSTVAESDTGVTKHPTQNFTANATTDLLTCNQHGVKQDDQIVVSTTTTLPGGLVASTRYFAVDVGPNDFGLATRPNGPKIDVTSTGSGTHSFYIVGSVQKVFLAADVDTVGRYSAWWTIYSGSDYAVAPVERQGLVVEVLPFGN